MKEIQRLFNIATVIMLLMLTACNNDSRQSVEKVKEIPGIVLENMDNTVEPKDDFFRFVNGTWYDKTEIPDDRSSWGGFNELRKQTDADALEILSAAMSENKELQIEITPGSDQEKAVNLYKTIMDTAARNDIGLAPLDPYLAKIEKVNSIDDLQSLMIDMEPKGGIGFFGFGVRPDAKNSNINAGYLRPAGLGLPDRDYYVKEDADSKDKREKYVSHITKMLMKLGDSEAEASKQAQMVLAFETQLAEPMMDKVDRRDARKRYNPKTMDEMQKLVPAIDWDTYFEGIGVKELDTVIVTDVNYMRALQKVLAKGKAEEWKAYMKWSTLNNTAGMLTTDLEKANWEFYGKTLGGAKKQRPSDERALQTLNRTIGEALGKLYVDKKFPAEAKQRAEEMIDNVVLAFEDRIEKLDWMSDETKEKAIEKLKAINIKIAYPDDWKDYGDLTITSAEDGGSYLQNMLNATSWNYAKDMEKLGKEVDKTEWFMAPQIVNAYFNPPFNEIVFPAAILQPPFYNYTADDAVNYGGIGAVIGHEISHSFDDSGSRYDKNGNLNNWWTDQDLEKFEALGKKLADQYSDIEVLPQTKINGAFTLGENIGDLGGVLAAYDALQLSFEKNGRPENIDGFTPEQRFFMSWATIWRTKAREESIQRQIKTDPHSPGAVRAIQPLRNVDAFYSAFDIKEGDKMYVKPEDRVRIW